MLQLKKKNRGFTLIEVVLAIGIAAVAFGALTPVVSMIYRINHSATNITQAQLMAQTVATQLEAKLRYARSVSILDALPADTSEDERGFIYTRDGQIYERRGGTEALVSIDRGYAYRYRVDFAQSSAAGVVEARIAVLDGAAAIYDFTEPVYVHNLTSGSVGGLNSGAVVAYLPPVREAVAVASIAVSAETSAIVENEQTLALRADIYPLGATNRRLVWSVDDPALAAVTAEGLLIPLQNGTVTVTATAADGSGVQGQLTVFIDGQEPKITALTLDTETGLYAMAPGESLRIIPTIEPEDAFNQQLSWRVDNSSYATVSDDGLLTARGVRGVSVMVTASTRDGSRLERTIEILIR